MAFHHMYQDSIDELDAAQKILIEEAEAKKRRKREETRAALDRIRARITAALHGYEDDNEDIDLGEHPLDTARDVVHVRSDDSSIEVSLDSITDPDVLFKLLADVRFRNKYEKKLTVVVVQIEDLQQENEEVLKSLDAFFQENRASNMEEFIAEFESEEVDIEQATSGVESALQTATRAATRLVAIEKDISQLISIASSYPSTKKGRKKLEKALVKAQEEVQSMSTSLSNAKKELEESQTNCDQLQSMLSTKTAECTNLKKTAEQARKLQVTSDSMKTELAGVMASLKKAEQEIQELKAKPPLVVTAEPKVIVDEEKIKELEAALEESKALCETTQAKYEEQTLEIENIKTLHDNEITKLKASHNEQLQSLAGNFDEETTGKEQEDTDYTAEVQSGDEDIQGEFGDEAPKAVLLSELAKVKKNAQMVTTSLQAQLMEAQGRQEATQDEITNYQTEVKNLTEMRLEAEIELQAKQEECGRHIDRIEELETALKTLSIELKELTQNQKSSPQQQSAFPTGQQMDSPPVVTELPINSARWSTKDQEQPLTDHSTQWSVELTNHSTQWSDGVMSSNRTATPQSVLYSPDHPPALQMEEVQMLSPLTDKSIMMSLGSASVHHLHGSPQHSGGSPLHSGSIVDGRALTQGEMFLLPANLSGSSNIASEKNAISPDNPVVQEWSKAVDQVMRFKSNIIEVLSECQALPSSVRDSLEELKNQTDLNFETGKDISGQVTQMRFSLALILHQLETALKESFTVLTPDSTKPKGDSFSIQGTSAPGKDKTQEKLAKEVAKLQRQLQLADEIHKQELRKNKETMANLSMKIGTLKTELSTAKQQLSEAENQINPTVFFTRLDYERNKLALEDAVLSKKLSSSDYDSMVMDMEDYLSLPGQRLQFMKHQVQREVGLKKAYAHVRNQLVSSPEHTSQVLTMIQHIQNQRRTTFLQNMSNLSKKRLKLAEKLQTDLTETEASSGSFLIKPMYPTKSHGVHSLISPMKRTPPNYRPPMPTPSSRVSKRGGASSHLTPQPHPTLQLINELRSELNTRQQESREQYRLHELSTEPSTTIPTRPVSMGSGAQWTVPHTPTLPSVDLTPVLPRLVELEVKQLRHPDFLLSRGASPSSRGSSGDKETMKDSISRSLIRDGKLLQPTTAATRNGNSSSLAPVLPPIQVPYPQQQSVT